MMTNKECIEHLQRHRLNCKEGSVEAETLDMAIKALESFSKLEGIINDNFETFLKKAVDALTEHPVKGDLISREDAISTILKYFTECERMERLRFTPNLIKQTCADLLSDLPSATSQPKVGRWIPVGDMWRCSECKELSCCQGNFCSDCGIKMEMNEK